MESEKDLPLLALLAPISITPIDHHTVQNHHLTSIAFGAVKVPIGRAANEEPTT